MVLGAGVVHGLLARYVGWTWTRYVAQTLIAAWLLVPAIIRLIEPNMALEWIRGLNLWPERLFYGEGDWGQISSSNKTWVDLAVVADFAIGTLLLFLTLYGIANACEPGVIC
jgi:hypothetical protein